jgi:MOSC domain-containing protein YiiM
MSASVLSTNLARPKPDPGEESRDTGIDKRPVPQIDLITPGPRHGDGSGAVGDLVGDLRHHGGADKAVYAYAREELDHWQAELGRGLSEGTFGENLTTVGIDLEELLIGQRLRVGEEVVLEVSLPRQPCATFAGHLQERGWVRRFTQHGRCGAYLRVPVPGTVRPGDPIEALEPPPGGVSLRVAFAAVMGDHRAAEQVVAAGCLPRRYHDQLAARLGRAR